MKQQDLQDYLDANRRMANAQEMQRANRERANRMPAGIRWVLLLTVLASVSFVGWVAWEVFRFLASGWCSMKP